MIIRENINFETKIKTPMDQKGDSNSRFFHKVVNQRFKRNKIVGLNAISETKEQVEDVTKKIKSYFDELIQKPITIRSLLDRAEFQKLKFKDRCSLLMKMSKKWCG